jgi:hypothetical protein
MRGELQVVDISQVLIENRHQQDRFNHFQLCRITGLLALSFESHPDRVKNSADRSLVARFVFTHSSDHSQREKLGF